MVRDAISCMGDAFTTGTGMRGLAQHPALPASDPRIVRRGVRPVAGQHVQHAQHAQHAVEAVLAGGVGAEAVAMALLQRGVRQ